MMSTKTEETRLFTHEIWSVDKFASIRWDPMNALDVFQCLDDDNITHLGYAYGIGTLGCLFDSVVDGFDSFEDALEAAIEFMDQQDDLEPKYPGSWKRLKENLRK